LEQARSSNRSALGKSGTSLKTTRRLGAKDEGKDGTHLGEATKEAISMPDSRRYLICHGNGTMKIKSQELGDACQDSRRTSHTGTLSHLHIMITYSKCTKKKNRNEKNFSIEARKTKTSSHFICVHTQQFHSLLSVLRTHSAKVAKDTRGFI